MLPLAHVYLLTRGFDLDNFLTFWLPLEGAALLVLLSAFHSDDNWVLGLILAFAATLHFVLPISQLPDFNVGSDSIYGYQLVTSTLSTHSWVFGAGTGEAQEVYSNFPLMFIFAALWSGIGSLPPFLIVNYAMAAVNLVAFLTFRMLGLELLNLSKRQVNLALFLYSLTPTLHNVEARFHYEAYAAIFFSLVLLYALKPKISLSEAAVAAISIVAIAFSHYFTAYILLLNAIVIVIAYALLKGTRVQVGILLMTIVVPLATISNVAVRLFESQVLTVENIFTEVNSLTTLLTKFSAVGSTLNPTYYPALWFGYLATIRNVVLLLLGIFAIVTLCLARKGRFGARIWRKDSLTYVAAIWVFSVFFAVAAYYGIAWTETAIASEGAGSARTRIAEFSFLPFALLAGLGLSILLQKINGRFRVHRIRSTMKTLLAIALVVVFVSSVVVQAYPRAVYESNYIPNYYDEYKPAFQEPYYLGNWWNAVADHATSAGAPFSGSRSLRDFVQGYGYQIWWEDSLTSPSVNVNNTDSSHFNVYYAIDFQQFTRPDPISNQTISHVFVSSGRPGLNMIFNNGRLSVIYKPSNPY